MGHDVKKGEPEIRFALRLGQSCHYCLGGIGGGVGIPPLIGWPTAGEVSGALEASPQPRTENAKPVKRTIPMICFMGVGFLDKVKFHRGIRCPGEQRVRIS